jgi:DNA-binding NtrC family response regulator
MSNTRLLSGKKILAVDDEPDILMVLKDLLWMCDVTTASNFEEARDMLKSRDFDAAILDIMGVDGYRLLDITKRKEIPTIMLTAHAFTPDNLVRSIKEGAFSYLPKEAIKEIADCLSDVLKAELEGRDPWVSWQERLPPSFFEKRWGAAWQDADKEFWESFRASIQAKKNKPQDSDPEK